MARDIHFNPVSQASFGDANQLRTLGVTQGATAFDNAVANLANINKAVTQRNDAVIKRFINGLSQSELESNPDKVNQFIDNIDRTTGGMYSAGDIEDYRDKRTTTLVDRDIKKAQAKLADIEFMDNSLKYQKNMDDFSSERDARILAQYAFEYNVAPTPEVKAKIKESWDNIVRDLYDNTSPDQINRIMAKVPQVQAELFESQNTRQVASNKLEESTADSQRHILIGQFIHQMKLREALANPDLPPEDREELLKQLQDSREITSKIEKAISPNQVYKAYDDAVGKFRGRQQEDKDSERKDRELSVKELAVQISGIRAENAGSNGSGNGSSHNPYSTKDKSENEAYIINNGFAGTYQIDPQTGSIGWDGAQVATVLGTNVNNYYSQEVTKALKGTINYNDWLVSKEGTAVSKELQSRGSRIWGVGFDSVLTNIQEGFAEFDKDNPSMPLTGDEKKEFTLAVYHNQIPIDEWFTWGDSASNQVNKFIETRRKKQAQDIAKSAKEYVREQVKQLANTFKVSEADVLKSSVGAGAWSETYINRYLPDEYKALLKKK